MSNARKLSIQSGAINLALLLALLVAVSPVGGSADIFGGLHVVVPLEYYFFIPALIVVLLCYFRPRVDWRLYFSVLTLHMLVFGVLHGFDARFLFADFVTYISLIAGIAWGNRMTPIGAAKLLVSAAVPLVALGWFGIVLLWTGCVESPFGERKALPGLWTAGSLGAYVAPLAMAVGRPWIGMSCLICSLAIGVLSATRSTILVAALGMVFCVIIAMRMRLIRFLMFIFCLILSITAISLAIVNINQIMVIQRFSAKGLDDNSRALELSDMLASMNGSWWSGRGFGSTYLTTNIDSLGEETLARMPHVAMATYFFKGGILLSVGVAAALMWGSIRAITPRTSSLEQAWWLAFLVVCFSMCLSGGWFFPVQFVAGCAIECGLSARRKI